MEKFDKPAIQKYIAQYAAVLRGDPHDRDALLALGLCYLGLGLHDLAEKFLQHLIDSHPAEPAGYYHRALCLLKGRRPRTATLAVVRAAEHLVETAIELDPANGRYDLVLAGIRYDYYVVNGLRVPVPPPEELAERASAKHVDDLEVARAFSLLGLRDSPARQLLR